MGQMPFSREAFFGVFTSYNHAVWPAQLVLLVGAVVAVALAVRRGARSARWVWAFLAALWLWTGIAYHILHFSAVNPPALAFGALFVVQAALFLWVGVVRRPVPFGIAPDAAGLLAALMLAYALVVYPVLGSATGHAWFDSPTFGAPCPVVIYTFGMLLLAPRAPGWLLAIPVLWALVGTSAVFAFGVVQDVGLPVSAAVAVAMILLRRRREPRADLAAG